MTNPKPWLKPGFSFQVRDDSGAIWPPGFTSAITKPTALEIGHQQAGVKLTQQLNDPEARAQRDPKVRLT